MTTRGKSDAPAAARTVLYRDKRSFQGPLDEAIRACTETLTTRTNPVRGSEARLRAALDDNEALRRFADAVKTHLRHSTFHDLPPLRKWGRRLQGLHQLTCGPFRGVFLVSRDGAQVVALVFSREPHDYSERLNELAVPYRTSMDEADDEA